MRKRKQYDQQLYMKIETLLNRKYVNKYYYTDVTKGLWSFLTPTLLYSVELKLQALIADIKL